MMGEFIEEEDDDDDEVDDAGAGFVGCAVTNYRDCYVYDNCVYCNDQDDGVEIIAEDTVAVSGCCWC